MGRRMPSSDQSPESSSAGAPPAPSTDAELEQVLKIVPKGALALAGAALGLLMLAWFVIYFVVFLPRGPIS
jgi:hypothetical protein